MKIAFILLNAFATAAVIAQGTAAQAETLPSHPFAATGYEIIGEPEQLSVADNIALQPTLYDIFKNSDYYYGSLYRSKLPHGIDPWADYHQGHHGKSFSHGLFGNHSGCHHSGCHHSGCHHSGFNPLAAILKLPFSLFGGRHSTGCGANCDGGSDCDAKHCDSCAPSTWQPPQEQPNSSTLDAQQQTPVFQYPQTVEPPRPTDLGVQPDVRRQPIQPEGGQPNNIDIPENDLPVNVIPDDYLPAEPAVLTPTRVEVPRDLNLRIREATPIYEAPRVQPPANALPEHSLLNDSAQYLSPSRSNTLGATIHIAAPQQAVPLRSPQQAVPLRSQQAVPLQSQQAVTLRSQQAVPLQIKQAVPLQIKQAVPLRSQQAVPQRNAQARSGFVQNCELRIVPIRIGESRELRTADLVKPTRRAARPEGTTLRFRVYQ